MCDVLQHRGPNDSGVYTGGPVAMGSRRLSIIDIADGHQPISNSDDTIWIVFNGEIYNHRELRAEMERLGYQYKTNSDTETVLHLYEAYGPQCVTHLRGMFAIAIWDERLQRMFIARDRLGIKPLYYAETNGHFVFASEVKSILALEDTIDTAVDWTAMDSFFAYSYVPAPHTIFKGIRKLLPGHRMLIQNGQTSIEQYWDLSFSDQSVASEEQLADEFLSLFDDAVDMHLLSEAPVGAFLSGGMDSSLIVALMSQSAMDPVKTFSIGFGGELGNFTDERPFAREVSRRFGTEHTEFELQSDVGKIVPQIVRAFDEPFADDSVLPTWHLCESASKSVTVALTGLGGDENFAGYERHLGFRLSNSYERVPAFLRNNFIHPLVNNLKENKGGHIGINHLKRFVQAAGLGAAERYQSYISPSGSAERRQLYVPDIAKQIDFDAVTALGTRYYNACDSADPLDRALYQDIRMYLPDDLLTLNDRIGMAHSLELRPPFLDHKIVEFCASIPSRLKLRRFEKKYLLGQAARSLIPDSIVKRRKQGFASPMAIWLRHDMKGLVESALNPDHVRGQGIFDANHIADMLSAHQNREALHDKKLFALLMSQEWLKQYT
jgi:asparagine synthase (glutamine-hydrolysing)